MNLRPLLVSIALLPVCLCIGAALPGCAASPAVIPATQLLAQPTPYMLHLPGIGGERTPDHWLVKGLEAGGVRADVEIYDWTENDPGLDALHSYDRNHVEAQLIADKITAHYRAEPDRPIYLTSHSGGCGVGAWALEDLPEDVHVEKFVMLAPALSPNYDLSKALRHVHGHAFAFYSNLDTLVLRMGTTFLGTIDGVKTPAAGYTGFTPPPGADARQYAKLVQYAYESDWIKYGNIGNHIGTMSRGFAQAILAPLLLAPEPLPTELFPTTGPALQ